MQTNSLLPAPASKPVAHAYSRFSTKDQAQGDSERRQKDKAQAWADANGYALIHLHDPGISAFHGRNRTIGQFQLFLSAVRARQLGPKPVLLIENFDRMSREVIEEAQALFLELINAGAVIVTLHNGKGYAKGMNLVDILTALVEMDVAHQHSAKLSVRVREAIDARRKAGGIIHNRASTPLWLTLDSKRTRFEPIPHRAKLIQRMFAMASKGQGPESIARAFNACGEPTWTKAKHWRGTTIYEILHNRSVLGEFNGRAGYFPVIITPEQWAIVNDQTSRAAQGRGNGVVKELNLLTGFAWSGLDGSKLILRSSGVKNRKTKQYTWHPYLVSADTIAGCSKQRHRVRYDVVEGRVLWLMQNLDPEMLSRAKAGAHDDTGDRIAAAEQHLASVQKQVAKLTRLVVDTDEPSPSLLAELRHFERELTAAQTGLEALKLSAAKVSEIPALPAAEELGRPETRRALRKAMAQWCSRVEIFTDRLIVWFTDKHGIRVNLTGIPIARYHDLDEETYHERQQIEADLAAEQQNLARQVA